MTTYEWGTSATACHINQNDEAYIKGMQKNKTKTFLNKEQQICYFENMGFSTGNMGGFYYQPWSYIYSINIKVSCEDSSSIPLYCAKTEKMADQVLLAKEELACDEKGGVFNGGVFAFKQDNGSTEYCISASCNICDSKWRNEYIDQWKQSECCDKRGKEPNQGEGTCEPPPPIDSTTIGIFYSEITEFPGCSEFEVAEDDGFCKISQSSSSVETSSSSEETSSSSEESSSSNEESSSSEDESSYSSESSSSSEESSSSSEFGLCQSLPFGYIPSDPKNTCFESNGKCYRCNAARRADECDEEWMWIYPYTPDKYFFTEIDCISGERKDNNRIGQCPGFPMETTPYNPEQACIAHNGKCYRCKSENSYVNCSYDWLWTGENFGTHNIGSWYEEVDCDDPFEEDDFDQCIAGNALFKQNVHYNAIQHEDLVPYSLNVSPKNYFDLLGRQTSKKTSDYIKLYNVDFTPSRRLASTKEISGHTDAKIDISWCVSNKEKYNDKTSYTIDVSLATKITNNFSSTNAMLQAHEDKHKELYMDKNLAFGSWEGIRIDVPKGKSRKQKCKLIIDSFWESPFNSIAVKWKLESLFNAHNNWDYQDENNYQHHLSYPDVNKTLDSLYNIQINKCKP